MLLPNMSESLGVWLATDNYSGGGGDRTISATTLLKSTRQIVLERRVDSAQAIPSINSLIASRIGVAIHNAIEQAWIGPGLTKALEALGLPAHKYIVNPTGLVPEGMLAVHVEQRVEKEIDGWIITGQYDIVIVGQLHDVKSTKSYVIQKRLNDTKWAMQGSIYRWLNPEVITDDSVVIECVVLDWSAAGAAASPEYPQQQWVSIRLKLSSLQETESFIRQKLTDITKHLDSPEADLPECTDEELWREGPSYAYFANPEATGRSTKNFDSLHDANMYLAEKGKGRVDTRPGKVKACAYCSAASLCTQRLRYLNE
jgi:hypothetical protein